MEKALSNLTLCGDIQGYIRRPWGAFWMVAEGGEGENPLPFSLQPQNAISGGGVGGVSRLRFPPGPHLRSSRFSRHLCLRQAPTRRFAKNRNLRGWAPSFLKTWPTGPLGPGSRHSHGLTSCKRVFNFLRRKPMGPGLKTLGCYHNPQSADLGGRWMVSEGGALQSHERRGSRLRSSISAPSSWGPDQQAPEPCIPAA